MDINDTVDRLLGKKAYLIDIFPKTVPQREDGRYFGVERILKRDSADTHRRFARILLKLYCYYDITVCAGDRILRDPAPGELYDLTEAWLHGDESPGDRLNVILPEPGALLVLDRDDLYMVLYGPDEALKGLAGDLARSEGLSFYEAPPG